MTLVSGARRTAAKAVREDAARLAAGLPTVDLAGNGDELEVPDFGASFSKALPHDSNGLVDRPALAFLQRALETGRPEDFERIPLGGFVKLADPQAGLMYDLLGPDATQVEMAPPPKFSSAEQAAEAIELAWQALARDIAFADYEASEVMAAAAKELSRLPEFRGPRREGAVTADTIFRGSTAGDLRGPYISQFLWRDVPYSPMRILQQIRTAVAGLDYLTDFGEWLPIQNGQLAGVNRFDPAPRYVRNGRDLGEFVHRDFTYQAFLDACLMLLKLGVPPDGGNPYKHSYTQAGFSSFGGPYVLHLIALMSNIALRVCWYWKWFVHRRIRPEELFGRLEVHMAGKRAFPLHASLLESEGIGRIAAAQSSHLLPQAYPEGAPAHPSYPAGHAVIAGACVTAMKAVFDESFVIPDPVVATRDGLRLMPWKGESLSVGDELDKLAFNIAMGRDFAGIHWRSDAAGGLALGEACAIAVLRELKLTGSELFSGYSLRCFDGKRIAV